MRFTVKAKLACAFGVVIVLSAVAGGVAYMRLSDTIATSEAIVARAGRMERATELEKNVLLQVRAEKNTLAVSGAELDQFVAEVGKIREATSKTRDEIDATASEDGKKLIASFSTAYEKMNTYQDETLSLAKTDKNAAAERSMHEGRKLVGDAMDTANAYVAYAKKAMADEAEVAKDEGSRAELLLLVLILSSLAVAVVAAVWISFNISRALGRAVGLAGAVANGDLSQTINVSSNDEIGDLIKSLNVMAEKLRQIVTEALTAAQNVSAGSQELSASAEQLSQGATEQASSAEEASSSMEEMAANVKQNAENANQTEKIAGAVGQGCGSERRRGGPCGRSNADDRREDHHCAGDRAPDRSARVECCGRGGARRRTRQGFCGGRLRSAQACRAQPGGCSRDRHAFDRDREGRAGSRRHAVEAGAGHQEDRGTGC